MSDTARSGRITQSSIDQVLQRSDLSELASGYTQLNKRGAEHLGRCPFHDEKTPSFWVNPTKGVYHCFGCGASGDVITFLQVKQGLDFVEAIEFLADRYRVELEYEEGSGKGAPRISKRRLYELTEAAANYYHALLTRGESAEPVRRYLADRHISDEAIAEFKLGYSPESSPSMADKARTKGFSKQELGDARLITSHGRDFFRGRLMIPIIDRADRAIGFGARKLREDQFGGKYVNSADGALFSKKRTIFTAPGVRKAAADSGFVVVVEGYMDVIAMWQVGYKNTCAVMGTALTEEQVIELKRLAPKALFAFDPDTAGQVATLRALDQAREHDLDVRVVLLPVGEDPADVLFGADGRTRMQELIDESVTLLHYRVSALLGSGNLADPGDRDRVYNSAIKLFRSLPDGPSRRQQMMRVANALQLDAAQTDALAQSSGSSGGMQRMQRTTSHRSAPVVSPRRTNAAVEIEKRLLAAAMQLVDSGNPGPVAEAPISSDDFMLDPHRVVWRELQSGSTAALDISRIREDAAMVTLMGELTRFTQPNTLWSAGADPADSFAAEQISFRRNVITRRQLELADAIEQGDDAAAVEYAQLNRQLAELSGAQRR